MIRVIHTCLWWPLGSCTNERVPGTDLCTVHCAESKEARLKGVNA